MDKGVKSAMRSWGRLSWLRRRRLSHSGTNILFWEIEIPLVCGARKLVHLFGYSQQFNLAEFQLWNTGISLMNAFSAKQVYFSFSKRLNVKQKMAFLDFSTTKKAQQKSKIPDQRKKCQFVHKLWYRGYHWGGRGLSKLLRYCLGVGNFYKEVVKQKEFF